MDSHESRGPARGRPARGYRVETYIVISKPKRMSQNEGVVQVMRARPLP
jgi:hypothetical protein